MNIPQALERLKIKELNPMQEAAVEANRQHDNVMLLSATGSGKTLAFLLPLWERLNADISETQAMIVVPSRELALQIEQVFKQIQTGFKVTCCYGGHKREIEENNLTEAPALVVGTPGRIGDHLRRGNIRTGHIHTLVLDEFDKSLELGFLEEMSFIAGQLTAVKHNILTSATQSVELPSFLALPQLHTLNFLPQETANTALDIKLVKTDEQEKVNTLFRLLCHLGVRPSIIFCNHREVVEQVSAFLSQQGIVNVFYHGALEQHQRDMALCKFRNGTSDVLVTTDLAARGLDIAHIRYIIHFHLPPDEASFTHRNGRTARMFSSGTAILMVGPGEYVPKYLPSDLEEIGVPDNTPLPEKPKWATLFFAAGKKDKLSKTDIVGFLANKGQLRQEDIGLIEVKDFASFVAVRKSKASTVLQLVKDQKIKNRKIKIAPAK